MAFTIVTPAPESPLMLPSLVQASDPTELNSFKDLMLITHNHLHVVAQVFFHTGLFHLFDRFAGLEALIFSQKEGSVGFQQSFKDFVSGVEIKKEVSDPEKLRRNVMKALTELRAGMPRDASGIRQVLGLPPSGERIYRLSRENRSQYLRQIKPLGLWMAARQEERLLDRSVGETALASQKTRPRI